MQHFTRISTKCDYWASSKAFFELDPIKVLEKIDSFNQQAENAILILAFLNRPLLHRNKLISNTSMYLQFIVDKKLLKSQWHLIMLILLINISSLSIKNTNRIFEQNLKKLHFSI